MKNGGQLCFFWSAGGSPVLLVIENTKNLPGLLSESGWSSSKARGQRAILSHRGVKLSQTPVFHSSHCSISRRQWSADSNNRPYCSGGLGVQDVPLSCLVVERRSNSSAETWLRKFSHFSIVLRNISSAVRSVFQSAQRFNGQTVLKRNEFSY